MVGKKVYGYARVSSKEQHLDRQIAALSQYVTNSIYLSLDKIKELIFSSYFAKIKIGVTITE